jgi:RNase E specificity factor CsrD
MKLTRILTKKLTSFWLMSLAGVAFVLLLCAFLSFIQLTYQFQQQKVTELQQLLDEHFRSQPVTAAPLGEGTQSAMGKAAASGAEPAWALDTWLPPLLIAYNAARFSLSLDGALLFEFEGNIGKQRLTHYDLMLGEATGMRMQLALPQPFAQHQTYWYEWLILAVGLLAVIALVRFGFGWFSSELEGIEALAQRSRLILLGRHEEAMAATGNGRPRMIDRALTRLLEELQDAHKERTRFDKFIRTNTFLDPQTRIGNRLFLNNRLDALSNQQGMMSSGVLYLLELEDLDLLQQEIGDAPVAQLLHSTVNAINQVLQSQANSLFARRSHHQFAILVPQISLAEADALAARLLKICLTQALPVSRQTDNFFHLGGAYFTPGDNQHQLLEEAELALRAAQLQGNSCWFMYDKGAVDEEFAKGSVRWRSFLENALAKRRFVAFSQPVMDSDGLMLHQEISTRVLDKQGNFIRATQFIPMAVKCGLMPQIERQIIENVLFDVMPQPSNWQTHYCINLSLDSLGAKEFMDWLKTTLLEQRHLLPRLIFEVSEGIVMQHREMLQPRLNLLRKLGVRLSVDHVGQQVVSTQYIKECHFSQIKLHRSIVRQIHLRPENQLFIRSLIAGLYRTEVLVGAEGVEALEEWQTLRILGVSLALGTFFRDPVELMPKT